MPYTLSKIANTGKVDFKEGSVFLFSIASNFNISTDGQRIFFTLDARPKQGDFSLLVSEINLPASGLTAGPINSVAEQIKTNFFPDASAGSGGGGGGGPIGDGSITTANLANEAVTFAKFQNIATQIFLGRNSSETGDVEQIGISLARAMLFVSTLQEGANPLTTTYERNYVYGDFENPITGNIQIQEDSAIQGACSIFFHQSLTKPIFEQTLYTVFLNEGGLTDYILGAVNFIAIYPILSQTIEGRMGCLVYIKAISETNQAPNLSGNLSGIIERSEIEIIEGNGINSGGTLVFSTPMKIPAMRFSCNAIGDVGAKGRYFYATTGPSFNPSLAGNWAYEEKVVFGQLSTVAERFIYASPFPSSALTDPIADGNSLQFFYAQNINDGKLALKYRTNYLSLNITPSINTQYILAMRYTKEDDFLRAYVNGTPVAILTNATTAADSAFRIPNATLSMRSLVYKTAHVAITNTVDISKRILEIYG